MSEHNSNSHSCNDHENVKLLLPWYVNNTLDEQESALVRRHIGSCLVCRADVSRQKELLASMQQNDPSELMLKSNFDLLRQRIHANIPDRPVVQAIDRPAPYRWQNKKWSPMLVAATLSAVAVGLVMMSNIMNQHIGEQPELYKTLSSSSSAGSEHGAGEILVVFNDGTSWDQIMAVSKAMNLEIMTDNKSEKVLRARVLGPQHRGSDMNGIVAALRNQNSVMFAEVALAGE